VGKGFFDLEGEPVLEKEKV
jgi:hypothetical protein